MKRAFDVKWMPISPRTHNLLPGEIPPDIFATSRGESWEERVHPFRGIIRTIAESIPESLTAAAKQTNEQYATAVVQNWLDAVLTLREEMERHRESMRFVQSRTPRPQTGRSYREAATTALETTGYPKPMLAAISKFLHRERDQLIKRYLLDDGMTEIAQAALEYMIIATGCNGQSTEKSPPQPPEQARDRLVMILLAPSALRLMGDQDPHYFIIRYINPRLSEFGSTQELIQSPIIHLLTSEILRRSMPAPIDADRLVSQAQQLTNNEQFTQQLVDNLSRRQGEKRQVSDIRSALNNINAARNWQAPLKRQEHGQRMYDESIISVYAGILKLALLKLASTINIGPQTNIRDQTLLTAADQAVTETRLLIIGTHDNANYQQALTTCANELESVLKRTKA